jgi:hypothetical protein
MKIDAKKPHYTDVSLGNLSITGESLLDLVERTSKDEKLSLRSGDFVFDSVSDARANIASFCGYPEVDIGDVSLKFTLNGCRIYNRFGNEGEDKLRSIESELRLHKKIVDRFFDHKTWIFALIQLTFTLAVSTYYLVNQIGSLVPLFVYLGIAISFFAALELLSRYRRKPVYTLVGKNFFQRNFDSIFSSLISGIVMLFLGLFLRV